MTTISTAVYNIDGVAACPSMYKAKYTSILLMSHSVKEKQFSQEKFFSCKPGEWTCKVKGLNISLTSTEIS